MKRTAMKTLRAFRILLVVVMVILPMVAVTPANAGKGMHHQMDIPENFDINWLAADNPCQTFDIQVHQEGYLRINYWTDANGWWIKEFDSWGHIKRTATVGDKTVKVLVQGGGHYEYTYPSENVAVMRVRATGVAALIIAPGYGKVWGGAGLADETYTFDTTDPNNWIATSYSLNKQVGNQNYDDASEFCEYMAP